VAVWSGWVGIGQMTGFGEIHPFPGLWDSLQLDTAVTLPIGVEAYAAFALHAWLTSNAVVSRRTRRFARWSAIAALVLGMAGQVAYHLLTQAGVTRAPWEVTTLVSCLPVVVLGMGSALAHLLRSDAATARAWQPLTEPVRQDQLRTGTSAGAESSSRSAFPARSLLDNRFSRQMDGCSPPRCSADDGGARPPARVRLNDAQAAAAKLVDSGQRVSRRSLRSAGMHGSNEDLGMLARQLRIAQPR
jgi:hypothetical protein